MHGIVFHAFWGVTRNVTAQYIGVCYDVTMLRLKNGVWDGMVDGVDTLDALWTGCLRRRHRFGIDWFGMDWSGNGRFFTLFFFTLFALLRLRLSCG